MASFVILKQLYAVPPDVNILTFSGTQFNIYCCKSTEISHESQAADFQQLVWNMLPDLICIFFNFVCDLSALPANSIYISVFIVELLFISNIHSGIRMKSNLIATDRYKNHQ